MPHLRILPGTRLGENIRGLHAMKVLDRVDIEYGARSGAWRGLCVFLDRFSLAKCGCGGQCSAGTNRVAGCCDDPGRRPREVTTKQR